MYPLQDRIIDLALDFLDFYHGRKMLIQVILAGIILGSSLGFASAVLLPTVPDSALRSAQEIEAENSKKEKLLAEQKAIEDAKRKEEEEMKAFEASLGDGGLQDVYNRVIFGNKPEICEQELKGIYVDSCKTNYWTLKASEEKKADLCNKITSEEGKASCINSVQTPANISDEEIAKKAEACLQMKPESNQTVCWNSIYLTVALQTGDTLKCNNIKGESTKETCISRAEDRKDVILKEKTVASKDYAGCMNIIDTKLQDQCYSEILKTVSQVSPSCDKACVNKSISDIAAAQKKLSVCSATTTTDAKQECEAQLYSAVAKDKSDTSYCQKIVSPEKQATCKGQVAPSADKNPVVQMEVFKSSDRSFPQIGDTIKSPLEDNPYFQSTGSVLDLINLDGSLNTSSKNNSATIDFDVCKAYSNQNMKTACEDSLVLQVAIPAKDILRCRQIKDQTVEEYCELEIVQGDAIRAAEAAKQKCQSLSSQSTQQKCLQTLGFSPATLQLSTSSECLDYADPSDRIQCMRDIKNGGTGKIQPTLWEEDLTELQN